MKITRQLLSFPPYLSTPWENIASLQSVPVGSTFTLVVTLQNRSSVEVPGLDHAILNAIFEAHAQFLETAKESREPLPGPISFSLPLNPEGAISSLGSQLQHTPAQANLPDLPPDILEKITTIAKAFGLEDTSALSPPEEHCNCTYCQIIRGFDRKVEEESITEQDLSFRDWDVKQQEERLDQLAIPLDPNEHYSVFLGEPLGCTCGQKNCEHLKAALSS